MLTVKQIEAAKPKEKPYRLLDGNGLYLYVPVSGKKVWQLRYKIDGKEKNTDRRKISAYDFAGGKG